MACACSSWFLLVIAFGRAACSCLRIDAIAVGCLYQRLARPPATVTSAPWLVAFVGVSTTFKAKQRSSLMAQDGRPDTPPGQGRRRVDRTRAYKLNLYGSPLRICFCGSRKCFHGHGKAPRQHRGESTSRAPKAHTAQAINCRCSGVVAVMRGDGARV